MTKRNTVVLTNKTNELMINDIVAKKKATSDTIWDWKIQEDDLE
jgi:hypothetical protein